MGGGELYKGLLFYHAAKGGYQAGKASRRVVCHASGREPVAGIESCSVTGDHASHDEQGE